jgi:RNA polymerase sigma-70 factor (ECF subfamily)
MVATTTLDPNKPPNSDPAQAVPEDWPALLARAAAGDRWAIDAVLGRYRDYLRSIARRRLSVGVQQRIDASDLVQETFLEAHRRAGEVFGQGEPALRTTLAHILRCNLANALRDHLYAQRRSLTKEHALGDGQAAVPGRGSSPSMHMARRELAERFLTLLDQLPTDQAEALRMRYFEGLSVQEIALALDRSRLAAAGLLKRGLEQLRGALAGEESLWQNP